MPRIYQGRISRQFLVVVFLVSLLAMAVATGLGVRMEIQQTDQDRVASLQLIEKEWLPVLSRAVFVLSDTDIDLITLAIFRTPRVASLRLDIIGQPPRVIGAPIDGAPETRWPLVYDRAGEELQTGLLTVVMQTSAVRDEIARFLPEQLVSDGIRIILILLPITVVVHLAITRQINRLTFEVTRQQKQIIDGQIDHVKLHRRRLFPGRDEFDDLTDAFNQLMTAMLDERAVRTMRETQLVQSLGEKDVLLREVHHRVKNNLQVMISMLHLQAARAEDSAGARVLEEAERRMFSLALVHEQLYQREHVGGVELLSFSRTLLSHLETGLSGGVAAPISVRVEGQPMELSLDRAIPMALIINELATNAFEHAFKTADGGTITVSIVPNCEEFVLAIQDTGCGIPTGFSPEKSAGFGTTIVSILVQQIGGRISWGRSEGGGTLVEVRAPIS